MWIVRGVCGERCKLRGVSLALHDARESGATELSNCNGQNGLCGSPYDENRACRFEAGDARSIAGWLVKLGVVAEDFGAVFGREVARLDNILGPEGDAK